MPEIKLRYNETLEEVELLVDNEVALTSGKDVFESWVSAYNEAHPQEPVQEEETNEKEVEQPAAETDSEDSSGSSEGDSEESESEGGQEE